MNQRGYITMISVLLLSIVTVMVGVFTLSLVKKNEMQMGLVGYTKKKGLVNAVVNHTINELKMQNANSAACSLKALFSPSSQSFNINFPKIYGKGEFQLDEVDENGEPTGVFYAPESDPEVYLDPEDPVGSGQYRLHLKMKICRFPVSGRSKFDADDDYGKGTAWSRACDADLVEDVHYIGVLNSYKWSSIYTIYYDRSFYTNIALDEPVEDAGDDNDELLEPGATDPVETVNGQPRRMTGSTHENSACAAGSRTHVAINSMLQTIHAGDPCAKVALYTVGGGSFNQNLPDPSIIRPVGPTITGNDQVSDNRHLNDKFVPIRRDLEQACADRRPAGVMNMRKVLDHYMVNHQPVLASQPPEDRGRRRVLLYFTDGFGYGELGPPEGDVARLSQTDVFFTDRNCQGTAVVETYAGPGRTVDYTGKLLAAGEPLYVTSANPPPASAPLPVMNPPLDPLPSGSLLVQSVMDSAGSCRTIIGLDGNNQPTYSSVVYSYFVKKPVVVVPKPAAPTTLSAVLEQYQPVTDYMNAYNGAAGAGLRNLPNAVAMFPLPIVDLDEQESLSTGLSKRPYIFTDLQDNNPNEMLASFVPIFKWISTRTAFEEGAYFLGFKDQNVIVAQ